MTLVGRTATVVRNGVTTIDQQEIPGITGGALDSHEGEPGPLYIQGDHTGGMKYRNITISLPER
jgi:3-keto-disaccharide hydrolase